jgi:hypothetical protein
MISFLVPKDGPVVDGYEDIEVVYARNQPEYLPLRTLKSDSGYVLSRWTLTDEQRRAVLNGDDIYLTLFTFNQPLQPISIFVASSKDSNRIVNSLFNETY